MNSDFKGYSSSEPYARDGRLYVMIRPDACTSYEQDVGAAPTEAAETPRVENAQANSRLSDGANRL